MLSFQEGKVLSNHHEVVSSNVLEGWQIAWKEERGYTVEQACCFLCWSQKKMPNGKEYNSLRLFKIPIERLCLHSNFLPKCTKRQKKKKIWVSENHDMWPDSLTSSNLFSLPLRNWRAILLNVGTAVIERLEKDCRFILG